MEDTAARVAAICERYRGVEGATLPILHEVQEAFGYVPAEAVPLVAAALNRTRAEIHGIVTFYRDFRDRPAGRHLDARLPRRGLPVDGIERGLCRLRARTRRGSSARPRPTVP